MPAARSSKRPLFRRSARPLVRRCASRLVRWSAGADAGTSAASRAFSRRLCALVTFIALMAIGALPRAAPATPLPALKVSANKHFLVTADGKPFFWLGDTAWELFHRLNRAEAERYLRN